MADHAPLTRWLDAAVMEGEASEGDVRLPSALVALLTVVLALLLGAALFGWRPAGFAAIVLVGLPLFWATSRLLAFSPLPVLAHVLVIGGLALAFFGPFRVGVNLGLGLIAAAAGVVIGASSAGWFLGRLVLLTSGVAGVGLARPWQRSSAYLWAWLALLAVLLGLGAVDLATHDLAVLTPARSSETFVVLLRKLYFGTFPWTGLVVLGLGLLAFPDDLGDERAGAAVVFITGLAFSLFAQTLWFGTWEDVPFMALWPLALGVGLLTDRVMEEGRPRKVAALVCGLVVLIGLRDQMLEPTSALAALGRVREDLPEEAISSLWFVVVTLLFGGPLVLVLARGEGRSGSEPFREWFRRYFGWLRRMHGRGSTLKWLAVAVPALLLIHGVIAFFSPPVLWFPMLGCLARRIWIAAGLVAPAGIALAFLGKVIWEGTGALGRARVPLVLLLGCAVTLASVHSAIPTLSRHFSSRGVVLAYERLRQGDEPLLAYRASTRAVELLGATEVEQVTGREELIRELTGREKVYALITPDDLARVDVGYRRVAEEHVPVVDNSSASTLLLASRLAEGQENLNPLVKVVPLEPVRPDHVARGNVDNRIELLGYDLEGSGPGGAVCPMSSFTLTFYWRCLRPIHGNQKIFVHIDGHGQRINGDHEPANGLYPVRHWLEGDVIVDELELEVPAHYHPGDYTIYVGFFQGSRRLPVKEGPATSDDRLRAGILRVR